MLAAEIASIGSDDDNKIKSSSYVDGTPYDLTGSLSGETVSNLKNGLCISLSAFKSSSVVNYTFDIQDITVTIDYIDLIKFRASGQFAVDTGVNTGYTDEISFLNSSGSSIGTSNSNVGPLGKTVSLGAGEEIYLYAKSCDGRKIISVEQFDGSGTSMVEISGDTLLPYLTEDGSVLKMKLPASNTMMGNTYTFVIVFDKMVYVTYDNNFNYLKWFAEGLEESGVVAKTKTWHEFTQSDSSASQLLTPLFPISSGWYWLKFDFTSDVSDPSIRWQYIAYDSNGERVSTSEVSYTTSGSQSFFVSTDGYIQFDIINSATGSTVTFSNFVLYPYDIESNSYEYMYTSLSASERTNTGKWNMPTPVREGCRFTGWNTKPDGSGITYTNNDPFPTKDLVLYSQWDLDIGSNVYLGTTLMDVYVGTTLVDVYVGTTLI